MRTLRMSWNAEEGRLVCRWVESEEGEKPQADSPTPQPRASRFCLEDLRFGFDLLGEVFQQCCKQETPHSDQPYRAASLIKLIAESESKG